MFYKQRVLVDFWGRKNSVVGGCGQNAPFAMPLPPSRNAPTFWNTMVAMLHFGTECPTLVNKF